MATSAVPREPAVPSVLATAVCQTVAYADIFDYPLTREEVFIYLPIAGSRAAVGAAIEALLGDGGRLATDGEYVFLRGRERLPAVRRTRGRNARRAWSRARRYGRIIWALPFVRMVAVTGALAMDNVEPGDDIDFLIITEPERLWTVRGLILLLSRVARLFGDTLCPNYLISTRALRLGAETLYSAHELAQMVPLHGQEMATRLWEENSWCRALLPNAGFRAVDEDGDTLPPGARQAKSVATYLLQLPPGSRVERWEQRRKIAKLSAQVPAGNDEVLYTADICKGHDSGHGRRIMQRLSGESP